MADMHSPSKRAREEGQLDYEAAEVWKSDWKIRKAKRRMPSSRNATMGMSGLIREASRAQLLYRKIFHLMLYQALSFFVYSDQVL